MTMGEGDTRGVIWVFDTPSLYSVHENHHGIVTGSSPEPLLAEAARLPYSFYILQAKGMPIAKYLYNFFSLHLVFPSY